jgi:MFS family permease
MSANLGTPRLAAAAASPSPAPLLGEFGQGRSMALLSLAGVASSVSVLLIYSLGSLIVPLQQGMGWSRADLQLAVSFLAAGGALSVWLVGALNARFGMRRVTAVSMLALAVAFACVSQLRGSIGWLYAAYFVLPFIGIGTTPVTWTQIVNLRFVRQRGLALSLVLCGSGISAALLPLLLAWSIGRWGWQAGYLTLALVPLAMWASRSWSRLPTRAALQGLQVASSAQAGNAGLPFAQVLRHWKFWVCNAALALVVSAIYGLATNIVPLLRDIGLAPAVAAGVFGTFGVSLIAGRIVVGALLDRLWAPGVAAAALSLPAIGCLLLLRADAHTAVPTLMIATALCGAGSGAEFDVAAYLMSRLFGLRDYGRLFGLHLAIVTIGSALAPFGFAALLHSTGGYAAMLALCGGACLLGPALLLTLGRMPALPSTSPKGLP